MYSRMKATFLVRQARARFIQACYLTHTLGDIKVSPNISHELQVLNLNREKTQEKFTELWEASGGVKVCEKCGGACCLEGSHSRFYSIDYWLHRYSTSPLTEYCYRIAEHPVKYLMRSPLLLMKHLFGKKTKTAYQPCIFLTTKGCSFQPKDRPITCALYTCSMARRSISEESLEIITNVICNLAMIADQTFCLLRSTTSKPWTYGIIRRSLLIGGAYSFPNSEKRNHL